MTTATETITVPKQLLVDTIIAMWQADRLLHVAHHGQDTPLTNLLTEAGCGLYQTAFGELELDENDAPIGLHAEIDAEVERRVAEWIA